MQVDPSKPLFGFIGRLEEQKGVDILLAALPQIAEKGDVQVILLSPSIVFAPYHVVSVKMTCMEQI